nr:immunoglobulin heavy chain junction region [Mus musculus]
CARCRYFDVW